MNTLEAIQLVKSKPPQEITAEELAQLRTQLETSPPLRLALGGADEIERYLNAAAEALSNVSRQAAPGTAPAPDQQVRPPRVRMSRRRMLELTAYALLLVAAAAGLGALLLPDSGSAGREFASVAAADGTPLNNATASRGATPSRDSIASTANKNRAATSHDPGGLPDPQLDSEPPDIWRGWRIAAAAGASFEKKTEWDRSNPAEARQVQHLHHRGGHVTLTRQCRVPADAHTLRMECHQQQEAGLGQLQVMIGGREAGNAAVLPVHPLLPILIPLPARHENPLAVTVIYTPRDAQECVTWRNLEFSPEYLDVMTAAGTEPDRTKPSLRLWLRADAGVKDGAGRAAGQSGFDGRVQTWEDQSSRRLKLVCEATDPSQRPGYNPAYVHFGNKPLLSIGPHPLVYRGEPLYTGPTSTTFAVLDVVGLRRKQRHRSGVALCTSEPRYALSVETIHGAYQGQGMYGHFLDFAAPEVARSGAVNMGIGRALVVNQVNGEKSFTEVNGTSRGYGSQAGGPSGDTLTLGWPGNFVELLIYNRALSSVEIRQIGAYLGAKYSVQH
ncbi:MAG: hypothetical protein K8T91_08275 [Planctomycetes bacterium]|nr:hypothetical protein [Planctomycetota bacterium]